MQSLAERKNRLMVSIEQMNDENQIQAVEDAVRDIITEAMLNAELIRRLDRLKDTPTRTWEEVKANILTKKEKK